MSFLGDLIIRLKAETADFTSDMGKAANQAERAGRRITSAFAAVGVAIGGGAIAASYRDSLKAIAALDDMAEQTGASVEGLSRIQAVAKIGGQDFNGVSDALGKMVKGLKDSDDVGQRATHALDFLGIKAKDANGKFRDTADILQDVAKALYGYEDGGNKVAIVQDILGKSGARYLSLLKDMAEEGDTHAKVTAEQAAQAEKFEKNLGRMSLAMEEARRVTVIEYLPALTNLTQQFLAAQQAGGGFLKVLGSFLTLSGEAGQNPVAALAANTAKIDRLEKLRSELKNQGAVQRFFSADDIAIVEKQIDFAEHQQKVLLELVRSGRSTFSEDASGNVGPQSAHATKTLNYQSIDPKKARAEALAEEKLYTSALQGLEKQYFSLTNAGVKATVQYEVERGSLRKLTGAHRAELLAMAAKIDAYKNHLFVSNLTAQSYEEMYNRLHSIREALDSARIADDQLIASMQQQLATIGLSARAQEISNFKFQEQVKLQERLRQIANTAGDDMAQYDKGRAEAIQQHDETVKRGVQIIQERQEKERSWMTGATKAMQEYRDAAEDQATQMHDLFSHAFQGMEDALVNFVKTGKLDFKSLADSIIADIIRIQIRAQLAKLFGDPSNGGGILESLGKFIFGGSSGGGAEDVEYGVARARGGRVNPGGSYWVGEEGPEPFIPDVAGTIVSRDALVSSERSGPNVMIDARGADAAQVQRLEQMVLALHGSFERRAVAANLNAARRGA